MRQAPSDPTEELVPRRLSLLLVVAGVLAVAGAFAVDLAGAGGRAGFGRKQTAILLAGLAALVAGVGSRVPACQGWIRAGARRLGIDPASMVRSAPGELLSTALWFGAVAGLAEAAVLAVRILLLELHVRDDLHRVATEQILWMAPVCDLLVFVAAGGLLVVLAALLRARLPLRVPAFVFALLAAWSLRVTSFGIHAAAWLLVAAGAATLVSRAITAHPAGFRLLVRRTTVWLLVAVGLLPALVLGSRALERQRALANLPPAAGPRTNVLLIVLDTVRAPSMSLHGYARATTPALEGLARSGVCFDRALSTSSYTLPSHGSMFTGQLPDDMRTDLYTPLDGTYPTLAEVLRDQGYLTAGFVANRWFCTRAYGLARGFAYYQDSEFSFEELTRSSTIGKLLNKWTLGMVVGERVRGRRTAERINETFLDWLSDRGDRPFFAFLNYIDAHDPYLPPEPFALEFAHRRPADPLMRSLHYPVERSRMGEYRDAYDGALAYLDTQVERLLAELRRRGVLDETLVIITSDHGEEFAEHGYIKHGHSLYVQSLHVPLLLRLPGRVPADRRIGTAVSLGDLPATVLDLLGIAGDAAADLGGEQRSLARHWREQTAPAGPVVSEMTFAQYSVVLDGAHYIREDRSDGERREELYDLDADPEEERDLAGSEEHRARLERCRAAVEDVLRRHGLRQQ